MSKNLYDYAQDKAESQTQMQSSTYEQSNQMDEEYIKSKVNEYSSMSQGEMLNKLFSEVQASKRNGSFDYNQISSSIEMVRDYLTPQQQKSLEQLLNRIK